MRPVRSQRNSLCPTPPCKCLRYLLALLCLWGWLAPSLAQAEREIDIRVIAHPDVEVNSLTKVGLRSIFGMRNRTWPRGDLIRVFVLTDNDPTHIRFTKHVLRTFPYNLRRIWDRRVYSGTGQSPVVVSSEKEMRDMISLTRNSIGYVSADWVGDNVKVLELR